MKNVESLGLLGPLRPDGLAQNRAELVAKKNQLDPSLRTKVISYLRSGAIVFARMEYALDVIDGQFGVSGGSAILTDGRFFWRADAAEYVQCYGIGLASDIIEWMRQNEWSTPKVSPEDLLEIDHYLYLEMQANPH